MSPASRPNGAHPSAQREGAPPSSETRAQAWALKQDCYEAWHSVPAEAARAAGALAALAAAHPADRLLAALADWTLGIAALAESRLADAGSALRSAQAGFEAEGDLQHAAETRVPQIIALSMLGRDAEAQACAEAALAQFVASGDERSAGKVELNLGTMLFRQDRHVEAEPRFRRAALRFARVGDSALSIMADGALANVLSWQFRFDEALQMFERARLRAQAHGLGALLSQMHQGIGQIELHQGGWQRALHHLATAVRRAADASAPPQRRLEAETALADAYLAVNLLVEAVRLYDSVIREATALQAPVEQAWATLQRARALGRMDDTAAARQGFDRAWALYEAAGNRPVLGLVALGRGRAELAAGDAVAALASAGQAVAALCDSGIVLWQLEAQVLSAAASAAAGDAVTAKIGFERVLRQAEGTPPLPQIAWLCLAGLGALARAAGNAVLARHCGERALQGVEGVRAALAGDELRSALGAEAAGVQAELVELAIARGDAGQLLLDMERGRARALSLALSLPDGRPAAPTPFRDDSTDAAASLQWLRQQWQQSVSEGDVPRGTTLAARVQALEHELLETHRRQEWLATPSATAAERPFDSRALPALQQALGPDRALVAYQLLGDRLVACVATSGTLRQVVWPAPGLAGRIRSLRFQIDSLRFGSPQMQRHGAQLLARAQAQLQALHAQVWAPVAAALEGRTRVVVLPHRELHYLPFCALHDGRDWLVQTHEIALAPSAAVWLALRDRPPPALGQALVLAVGGAGLPGVAHEAAAVATAVGPGAQVFLEADATQAVLARHAGQADVLHLACHGQFRPDSPAFSFLQLGDGPLTLHEAARLRLRAGLVVLSACETGSSRVAPGDEVLGLVRAFLLAGAATVLATQWPVNDAATATLMTAFYGALTRGATPVAALRQAQADAAATGSHPCHWAALAVHGRG